MFRIVTILTASVALCVTSPAHAQQQTSSDRQPLRIGATMSITGRAYSVQGGYGREGYLLCQKHLNAQGGLLGRPVELVIHDELREKSRGRLTRS